MNFLRHNLVWITILAWCLLIAGTYAAFARSTHVVIYSGAGDYAALLVEPLARDIRGRCNLYVTTHGHFSWPIVTADLENERRPIILVGYSAGAIAAAQTAAALYPRRVGMVTLDPATVLMQMPRLTRNVKWSVNFWKEGQLGGGHGFGAQDIQIRNVDHFSIEPAVRARISKAICDSVELE